MSTNPQLLIIEDEPELNQYLSTFLQKNGYLVESLQQGAPALKTIKKIDPQLIVLDLKLPDVDGEQLCREIKQVYPRIKIIILTAKDETTHIVHGFQIGADDYLTKPFSSEELLARIKARLEQIDTQCLQIADLVVDTKTMEVKRGDDLINLTKTEYKLLTYLLKNKNQVLTREVLLNHVWQYQSGTNSRVVDVYIGYLRDKIDQNYNPKLIHSVRGFGYILKTES